MNVLIYKKEPDYNGLCPGGFSVTTESRRGGTENRRVLTVFSAASLWPSVVFTVSDPRLPLIRYNQKRTHHKCHSCGTRNPSHYQRASPRFCGNDMTGYYFSFMMEV